MRSSNRPAQTSRLTASPRRRGARRARRRRLHAARRGRRAGCAAAGARGSTRLEDQDGALVERSTQVDRGTTWLERTAAQVGGTGESCSGTDLAFRAACLYMRPGPSAHPSDAEREDLRPGGDPRLDRRPALGPTPVRPSSTPYSADRGRPARRLRPTDELDPDRGQPRGFRIPPRNQVSKCRILLFICPLIACAQERSRGASRGRGTSHPSDLALPRQDAVVPGHRWAEPSGPP